MRNLRSLSRIYKSIPQWSIMTLSALIAGWLLSRSYWFAWPLLLISFAPLVVCIYDKNRTLLKVFLGGWLFGLCFMVTSVGPLFFSVLPLNWVGVSNPVMGTCVVVGILSLSTLVLSLWIGIWSLCARFIVTRTILDLVSIPLSWVIFESIRSWSFATLWWGSGSNESNYLSAGSVGLGLAQSDALLRIAQLGGLYALGIFAWLLVILITDALYPILTISPRVRYTLWGSCFAILVVLYIFPFVTPRRDLVVVTMTTDFPSTISTSPVVQESEARVIDDKLRAIHDKGVVPDVVVIPEGINLGNLWHRTGVDPETYLQSIFGQKEILLVMTDRIDTFTGARERIEVISSTRGTIATRDKYLLLPVGEYIPHLLDTLLRTMGLSQAADLAEQNRSYTPGTKPSAVSFRGNELIILACSELLSPTLAHDATRGLENVVLIDSSSQSIFHGNIVPFTEMYDMARIDTAWANAPYYQSTNGAPDVRIE